MSAQRNLVANATSSVSLDNTVRSPEDMQDIIREVLFDNPTIGFPNKLPEWSELVAEPDGKVSYDLRISAPRYNVRGVVGRMTRRQFKGMVWSTLKQQSEGLARALGGSWKPVAARLVNGFRMRTQAQPSGVAPEAIGVARVDPQTGEAKDAPQRTKHVPVRDQDIILQVAWAELTQSAIVCPTFEEFGRKNGKRYRFADSGGEVRLMATKDRDQRDAAKDIIKFTYGEEGSAVGLEVDEKVYERVRQFLVDYSMSVGEVARALKLPEETVSRLHGEMKMKQPAPPPKPKRSRKSRASK